MLARKLLLARLAASASAVARSAASRWRCCALMSRPAHQ